MTNIPSEGVNHGLNADKGAYNDRRNVKCGRCGHINNLDRATTAPYGSKLGQGIAHVDAVNDFTITGGCAFCGAFCYNKEEKNGFFNQRFGLCFRHCR